METNYDDRQTELEAGYRSDYSSVGMQTQRLAGTGAVESATPFQFSQLTPAASIHRNNAAAFALIGLGGLLLLSRLGVVPLNLEPGLILLTIASCFLFFAFWRRIYGLSIPGFILAGLSAGVTFADATGGVSVLWGLALGFFMIYILGGALFRVRRPWPMIPSVILFGVGCIVAIAQLSAFFGGLLVSLPLLLIGAGLYLGWGRRPT